MKKLIICAALLLFAGSAFAYDVNVNGHYRDTNRDGYKDTYVDSYHRTSPNNSRSDNYSSQGNYNPYTGQTGNRNSYGNSNTYGNTYRNRY
jgi:hypothetical protein